jgi:lipopolysaccharide transport system ATP-binding protein
LSTETIHVKDISKLYRLGQVGTGTLSHDLKRWWYQVRGKADPFLKLGEENRRDKSGGDYVWAVRDINFQVGEGEVLGIIGRNGAGKSTLLKLLSRVTAPTTGFIRAKGRIASLLEVGTGFHPELTGKENIYLNGAILGMRKHEITRKLDEIIDFSGVERYVDTPVKRYSSGMYVRLAFAVAAHLDSEILIVDEVLAVGDAEFQRKCIGKMGEVSRGQGRTILFVSHNMGAIKNLCTRILVLNQGKMLFDGAVNSGIKQYLSSTVRENERLWLNVIFIR